MSEFWQTGYEKTDDGLGINLMSPELRRKLEQSMLSKEFHTCRYQTDRYNLALRYAGKPEFRQSEQTFHNMTVLVKLRNDLIHYRPQTTDLLFNFRNNIMNAHPWERLLQHLPTNDVCKFMQSPHKFLNHTTAQWVLETSTKFVSTFFDRIGVTNCCDADERREQELLEIAIKNFGSLDEYYKYMSEQ